MSKRKDKMKCNTYDKGYSHLWANSFPAGKEKGPLSES